MHECPDCGFDCDCDGEDTWNDSPRPCRCHCEDLMPGDRWHSTSVVGDDESEIDTAAEREADERALLNEYFPEPRELGDKP